MNFTRAQYGHTSNNRYYAIVYNSNNEVLSAAGDLLSIDEVHSYFDRWGVDKSTITKDETVKDE